MEKHNEDPEYTNQNYDHHLFKSLIDNIDDLAIILIDEVGIIMSWNTGAQKILQYTEQEVLGKHFSLTFHKESVESKYPDYILSKVKEVGKFEHEGWRKRKDDSRFWAKSKVSAAYDENGVFLGYCKIIINLDEIKKITESRKDSDERYKILVHSVSDYAIFLMDGEGKISTWNPGAEKLLRYRQEEVLNKHFSIFYTKEDIDAQFPEFILDKARGAGKYEFEIWRKRKDGSLFWASTIVNAIKDSEYNVIGFSNVTRDLSAKKLAESDLWESEEKYRLLVEGVKDYAIILLDAEGFVKSWNSGAEKLKGYKAEEIIGKHFSIFYSTESKENKFPEYELDKAVKDGKFEHEGWRVRKDGSMFWTNDIIRPLYNDEGKLLGFSKISRDLSFRKNIEDELNIKNKELNKINSDLDNFIYAVSHDLRVPIANLEGLLDAIIQSLPDTCKDSVKDLLIFSKKSIENLIEVVKDLSEIGRIQKEENVEVVKVSFKELIDEFKTIHKKQIQEANAKIFTELQVEEIYFAKKNLRSILQNLILNAINYRSPDRILEIKIKTQKEIDFIQLIISDNGLGISKDHYSRIFEMFKRVYTHVEGTGIGLYIVKRIMDNVEGKIEVESDVGTGTTFKLFFPKI